MEPEDENKEDSLSLMLCKSCLMILNYSSLDFAKARRA
jgi:hypothetical protein